MSESQPSTTETDDQKSAGQMAVVIYVLYLVIFFAGVTMFIGVVMAYVLRGGKAEWVESHYRFQIRTFWIYFAYAFAVVVLYMLLNQVMYDLTLITLVTTVLLIGVLAWWVIRCIKGLNLARKGQAIPKSASWFFGG